MTRSTVLEVLGEDYVRTARAKGLSERRVLLKHVLRNSLIPIVTLWGLDFGAVLKEAQRLVSQNEGVAALEQLGLANLVAVGIMFEGRARVKRGQMRDGAALLDEAMVARAHDRVVESNDPTAHAVVLALREKRLADRVP